MIQEINIAEDDAGQRLDRWLKKKLKGTPFALLQKIIRTGQLRVNKKRVKGDYILKEKDVLRVPPLEYKTTSKAGRKYTKKDLDYLKSLIIKEDRDILCLNKPSGLPSQGGLNIDFHVDGLLQTYQNEKGVSPRLTHRLDRDTSGVLVCAWSLKIAQTMGKLFEKKSIKKYYIAIAIGAPAKKEGIIDLPLIKRQSGPDKDKIVVDNKMGKPSRTQFRCLATSKIKGQLYSLMAFWPKTGRTHQIRVHAASGLNIPLLGDEKYGGSKAAELGLAKRLYLHAAYFSCSHPSGEGTLTLEAPLDPDFRKALRVFEMDDLDFQKLFGG